MALAHLQVGTLKVEITPGGNLMTVILHVGILQRIMPKNSSQSQTRPDSLGRRLTMSRSTSSFVLLTQFQILSKSEYALPVQTTGRPIKTP
jgi:hypothetical protein